MRLAEVRAATGGGGVELLERNAMAESRDVAIDVTTHMPDSDIEL